MTFIDQIALPVFLFWFLGLVLVFFRKDLDLHWKISFLFLFVVYAIVFGNEWSSALDRLEENPVWEVRNWFYGIGKAIFYFLFLLWPITLIRLFYSSSKELARLTASLMVTVTVVFWILFWLYFRFQESIDVFLYRELIKYSQ